MEPPSSASSITSSSTPMTWSSSAIAHSSTEIGSSSPLTVPAFPLQPLTSINTSSMHATFPSGSSPLSSPAGGGTSLSPHGAVTSKSCLFF